MRSPNGGVHRHTPNGAHPATFVHTRFNAGASSAQGPIELGQVRMLTGDVTTLDWINARSPTELAASLGYKSTRLGSGYWIMLLQAPLKPEDFELGGITLRSGGRLGLPLDDKDADQARKTVMQDIIDEQGQAYYDELKSGVAKTSASVVKGPKRVAKVLPMQRLPQVFSPKDEFPMGGGGAQWTIKTPCAFLAAAYIDHQARASFGAHVDLPIAYGGGTYLDVLHNKMLLNTYLTNA